MKTSKLEKKLRTIAKNIGPFVVFRICVDKSGNIGIIGLDNEDFESNEDDVVDGTYPTTQSKIDIKKPLQYLEYIGWYKMGLYLTNEIEEIKPEFEDRAYVRLSNSLEILKQAQIILRSNSGNQQTKQKLEV